MYRPSPRPLVIFTVPRVMNRLFFQSSAPRRERMHSRMSSIVQEPNFNWTYQLHLTRIVTSTLLIVLPVGRVKLPEPARQS